MPLLLILLFLAGCASPGRELQRGSAVVPPPPVRPGHGAPVVGQPGQQAMEVPRSPHHRALPPTREPGLWAGDKPRASRAAPPPLPELLGVVLPGLPVSETQKETGFALACVALWGQALPGTGLAEKVNALRPAEKRCMVAWMYQTCARLIEQMDDNESEAGVVTLLVRKHRVALRQSAEDFTREECKAVRRTDAQFRLLESLRAALRLSLEPE